MVDENKYSYANNEKKPNKLKNKNTGKAFSFSLRSDHTKSNFRGFVWGGCQISNPYPRGSKPYPRPILSLSPSPLFPYFVFFGYPKPNILSFAPAHWLLTHYSSQPPPPFFFTAEASRIWNCTNSWTAVELAQWDWTVASNLQAEKYHNHGHLLYRNPCHSSVSSNCALYWQHSCHHWQCWGQFHFFNSIPIPIFSIPIPTPQQVSIPIPGISNPILNSNIYLLMSSS